MNNFPPGYKLPYRLKKQKVTGVRPKPWKKLNQGSKARLSMISTSGQDLEVHEKPYLPGQ